MYKFIKYTKEKREEWNKFARDYGTVFHLIHWKDILEKSFGYESGYYFIANENDEICALLPISVGRNLKFRKVGVCSPFVNFVDICCNTEEARDFITANMRVVLEKSALESVELRLKETGIGSGKYSLNESNYVFVLPLDGDEEKVMSYSNGSNRNHTRKVFKNNYFSASFDKSKVDDYYSVYCKRMKQLGSPSPDISFFKNTLEILPENSELLTVIDNETGKPAGGMFLLTFNDTIYYTWGSSLIEYNNRYINNFMYWEAVKFGIRNGFKHLDLGRSPLGSGTYRFKETWGAEAFKLNYCTFSKRPGAAHGIQKEDVGLLVELWKVMPRFITDVAGRKLIKHVMP